MNQVCDACGEPVTFSGYERTYEHVRTTACTGLDGIVLGVPERNYRDEPIVLDDPDLPGSQLRVTGGEP